MEHTISFDREGTTMDIEYIWFQRRVTEHHGLRPSALSVETHSEQEAKEIVEQIAVESDAGTITILAGHEHGKNPRPICGWRKSTAGTVTYLPPEDEDVKDCLEELKAQPIACASPAGTHQLPPA
jgi:hypothetical protein